MLHKILRETSSVPQLDSPPQAELILTGDFCPIGSIADDLLNDRQDLILSDEIKDQLSSAPAVCSLECPLTEQGAPIRKIGPHLRATPRAARFIKAWGFDVANLANNHISDYGEQGTMDTLSAIQAEGIGSLGLGNTHCEATRPWVVEAGGLRIGLVAFADQEFSLLGPGRQGCADSYDPRNPLLIASLKSELDHVVVLVHGGPEFCRFPLPPQRTLYRSFIDAGASAVACNHPHVVQGIEIYKSCPIFYSIGNFVFPSLHVTRKLLTNEAFMVKLSFDRTAVRDYKLYPIVSKNHDGRIVLMNQDEENHFLSSLAALSKLATDEQRLQAIFDKYSLNRYWEYYSKLINLPLLRDRPFKQANNLMLWHLLTCPAHREVLANALRLLAHDAPPLADVIDGLNQVADEEPLLKKVLRKIRYF